MMKEARVDEPLYQVWCQSDYDLESCNGSKYQSKGYNYICKGPMEECKNISKN